eukprot:CAMPEP_0170967462 /NCGR_PEP_ID=MMETSP0735-20130129/42601_1 /TAXON_ID=186038 /ORGANISM="Fragilariopsis kerguelensis, Strain L26-C5" /LENGTH=105 /DNA_ID=CAMNT_0011386153 /DNA_START=407 /DNA_END=720 /DNA_ORIENTATION=+
MAQANSRQRQANAAIDQVLPPKQDKVAAGLTVSSIEKLNTIHELMEATKKQQLSHPVLNPNNGLTNHKGKQNDHRRLNFNDGVGNLKKSSNEIQCLVAPEGQEQW